MTSLNGHGIEKDALLFDELALRCAGQRDGFQLSL